MPLDELVMSEGSWVTHEPDEWYPGLLLRLEDAPDYGFGETVRFIIQLDGEDGETWALASQKTLSPRTKLYKWVQAIDPACLPELGKPIKRTDLENRRVEVMFEAGEEREKVVKIRAEKAKAGIKVADAKPATIKDNQVRAAAAKKPAPADDESPF